MGGPRFLVVEKNGNGKRVVVKANSLEELAQQVADKTQTTVSPREEKWI